MRKGQRSSARVVTGSPDPFEWVVASMVERNYVAHFHLKFISWFDSMQMTQKAFHEM